MIKLLLCTAIALSCLLISAEQIRLKEETIRIKRELASSIEKMSALLKYQAYDVYQLCELCFGDSEHFKELSVIKDNFSDEWKSRCKRLLTSFDEQIYDLVISISDFLGMYDVDSQLSRLEYIHKTMNASADESKEKLEKDKKVYLTLGAFCGMMICLILA